VVLGLMELEQELDVLESVINFVVEMCFKVVDLLRKIAHAAVRIDHDAYGNNDGKRQCEQLLIGQLFLSCRMVSGLSIYSSTT